MLLNWLSAVINSTEVSLNEMISIRYEILPYGVLAFSLGRSELAVFQMIYEPLL